MKEINGTSSHSRLPCGLWELPITSRTGLCQGEEERTLIIDPAVLGDGRKMEIWLHHDQHLEKDTAKAVRSRKIPSVEPSKKSQLENEPKQSCRSSGDSW